MYCTALTTLIGDCQLSAIDGTAVQMVLAYCGSVDLSMNSLGCAGVQAAMSRLSVGWLQLEFAHSLAGSVRCLDLTDNDIRAQGTGALAEACNQGVFTELIELKLASNSLGEKACTGLLASLRKNAPNLQYLDLRDNGLVAWREGSVSLVVALIVESNGKLKAVRLCRSCVVCEHCLT